MDARWTQIGRGRAASELLDHGLLSAAASVSVARIIFLFGPCGAHLSVPAHAGAPAPRGAAVKDGHFGRPRGLVLDGCEHGGRLGRAGSDADGSRADLRLLLKR